MPIFLKSSFTAMGWIFLSIIPVGMLRGEIRAEAAIRTENRLSLETSPYLRQHRFNPVNWYPWGDEAFAAAREQKKPVFLSVGYSTCHWCHVMARESFENEAIAALLNESFISIKLDREERPDVDALYMAFVQESTGSGGWPLNVWMTPDGEPFFGGVYFPPSDRDGRVGFKEVLERIAELWNDDADALRELGAGMLKTLSASEAASKQGGRSLEQWIESGVQRLLVEYDAEHGGFGNGPKFPDAGALHLLFRYHEVVTEMPMGKAALDAALTSLRAVSNGGLRDVVGGGFFRYTVDRLWQVPHFEKMLYDQALIVSALLDAYQISKDEMFANQAASTLDFVLRDMQAPDGGFYSALDAQSLRDGAKSEGAYYMWTEAELRALLDGKTFEIFAAHYGIDSRGNVAKGFDVRNELSGYNVLAPRRTLAATAEILGFSEEMVNQSITDGFAKLYEARSDRSPPEVDAKMVTAWNGLLIDALSRAAIILDRPDFLEAAENAIHKIRRHSSADKSLRRIANGEGTGFASDYAHLIRGLLSHYTATANVQSLLWAMELQETLDSTYWDTESGGYFLASGDDTALPLRLKEDRDGAELSANGVAAENLIRFAAITHDEAFTERANKIVTALSGVLERSPDHLPSLLSALLAISNPRQQAVIAGKLDDPGVGKMRKALAEQFFPRIAVIYADGSRGQKLLASYSEAIDAMQPVNKKATLYFCENYVCKAPLTDPALIHTILLP